MAASDEHVITAEEAGTLDGLFRERARRTPDLPAYRYFDTAGNAWRDYTWSDTDLRIARWQAAFERDGLEAGDRVAVMLRNSPEWVMFDIASLGFGLIVVPLYTQDRPDNVAYILNDANCKVLLLGTNEQWKAFATVRDQLSGLVRILTVEAQSAATDEPRLKSVEQWLPDDGGATRHIPHDPAVLATIVYTSGTTGRPKGVMLSHRNILTNAEACLKVVPVTSTDVLLSFLPLSHTFERTCGYYLTIMCGGTTVYPARSSTLLARAIASAVATLACDRAGKGTPSHAESDASIFAPTSG